MEYKHLAVIIFVIGSIFTSRMGIVHTASVMFSQFLSFLLSTREEGGKGGSWVSGKVHSEHILATKVLMPMGGGGVSGKVHPEHILAAKVLMPVGGGGGSGKVHSEHILATKVLMPVGGGGGSLGKYTLSTFLLQKCSCPRGGWGGDPPGKCTIQVMSQK